MALKLVFYSKAATLLWVGQYDPTSTFIVEEELIQY